MALSIAHISFDCDDAATLARFWAAALARSVDTSQPEPSEQFARIGGTEPDVPAMLFSKVPEGRTAKNRVHLDLETDDRAGEVERLVGLGATVVHDRDEWGSRWTTLADPEGNVFCVASH